ncbi:MAG: YHYH protein [Alphaproteobacteria bacterium]|nr:YHYH protein [Alphaproteobacteria bacterium]
MRPALPLILLIPLVACGSLGSADCPQADAFTGADASCDGDHLDIESDGLPEYAYDDVSGMGLTAQDHAWSIPLAPALLDTPRELPLVGEIGVTVEGLPISPPNDGPAWGYGDPLAEGRLDACGGHTGMAGDYHVHAPGACADTTPGAVIGYALDGHPIVTPWVCGDDDCVTKHKVASSWQQTTPAERNPWYAWSFVEGSGDLDRCNGMTLDDGTYAYVATDGFPYGPGCFVAEPALEPLGAH